VKSKSKQDDDGSEGLAELIPDIQKTAQIVDAAVSRLSDRSGEGNHKLLELCVTGPDNSQFQRVSQSPTGAALSTAGCLFGCQHVL